MFTKYESIKINWYDYIKELEQEISEMMAEQEVLS